MGLEYHKIDIEEGDILLSPSSLAQLFDNAGAWRKTYLLGEKKFTGNDNTYLGSLLHNRIEQYYLGGKIDKALELSYLDDNNALDQWKIMEALEPMYNQWVLDYGSLKPKPNIIEGAYRHSPTKGFVIGGSIDAIVGDTIIDWKTSAKSKSSLADYKMQLYAYAFILRNNGMIINNVSVVNIVKPSTKGEVKVNILHEPIDEEYMDNFLRLLQLQVKRIKLTKEQPELAELLWMDNPFSYRS